MKPLGAIMAIVGYARVSSVGQSLDVQLHKLKDCDKIFQEKRTGTSDQRTRLKACLEYVRESATSVQAIRISTAPPMGLPYSGGVVLRSLLNIYPSLVTLSRGKDKL